MCFKIYTYPYFTYISNFQFQPTHKSHQSYHTQSKHNPHPPTISIPPPNIITPPNTHIPLLYPFPITPLQYHPYHNFHILSRNSYPIIVLSYPYFSLTLTPTLSISIPIFHPHIQYIFHSHHTITPIHHFNPTQIPSYTPIIITTYSVYIPIYNHTKNTPQSYSIPLLLHPIPLPHFYIFIQNQCISIIPTPIFLPLKTTRNFTPHPLK